MQKLSSREYWLDLVKGVAIIGVVLQHSLQRTIYYFDKGDTFFLPITNDFVASVNMQWFFVVSGYIYIAKREKYLSDPKNFFKTRFIDLMIPYLILGPVIWFGKFTLSAYVKNQVTFNDLMDMFVTPIAFMWFIYILFFVEIIIFLIDKYIHWKYEYTLGLLFLVYIAFHLTTGRGKDVFHLTPYYLFWYYLGGIFVYYKDVLYKNNRLIMTIGGVIWIVCFIIHALTKNGIFNILFCLGSTIWVCLFFKEHCSDTKINKLLNYLGNKTMYIYILNPIIINGLRQLLVKLDFTNITVNFFTFLLGALIIACIIAEIGKRFPPVGFIFSPRRYIIKK